MPAAGDSGSDFPMPFSGDDARNTDVLAGLNALVRDLLAAVRLYEARK